MRRPQVASTAALLLLPLLLALTVVGSVGAQDDPPPAPEAEGLRVARAAVCTGVEEREPVGSASTFPAGERTLYCFSEVRGAGEGETIVHAWIHEGTTRARVELDVRGERWRTWSSKQILGDWTGDWQVKILTSDGVVLETLDFTVE